MITEADLYGIRDSLRGEDAQDFLRDVDKEAWSKVMDELTAYMLLKSEEEGGPLEDQISRGAWHAALSAFVMGWKARSLHEDRKRLDG